MQEKKIIWKWTLLFNLIFIPLVLMAKTTSAKNIVLENSKTDVSICVIMNDYSDNDSDDNALKSYIKVFPDHYFSTSWEYGSLCLKKLKPNTDYKITLYKNMPLGNNTLDREYDFEATTLNYEPSINFPEEGYILPTKGEITIPVETKNIDKLLVSLYRINTRNLINSMNEYNLFRAIGSYKLDDIENRDGYLLWKKTLNISQDRLNTSKITAIPVGDFLKERKPGVYILYAKMLNDEGEEVYDYDTKMQWFMVSDIGVYTLKSSKGLDVLTHTLSSAKIYNNVKLELISKNNEILDSATTSNGHAFFPASVLGGKGGLEAKAIYAYGDNDDFSVLNLSKPAHDLTDRGVSGRDNVGKYDAFIYSNRDIFRPGESMTFHSLLRDNLGIAQSGINTSVKIFDSREVEVYSKHLNTDSLGHLSDTVDISESASTGRWRVSLYAGNEKAVGSYSFLVEDFIPPKIKVDVKNTIGQLKPKEEENIQIAVKYLNGEAFPHAKVEVTTILHKANNPFKQYPAYHFGNMTEGFRNRNLPPLTFETGETGELNIPLKIDQSYETSFPLSAYVDIAVSELGGRPVHKRINQLFVNRTTYIGMKPDFKNNSVDMEASPRFDLIYLKDAQPWKERLHYKLIEEKRHWHWRSRGDSWEYYKTYSDAGMIDSGEVDTSSSAPIELTLKKLDWGSYRLEVYDQNDTLTTYRFSSGYEESSSKASPDRLPVSINKQSYRVGDMLHLNIKSKFSGPVVIYIAHNDIVESKTVDAIAGKNVKVSFKVSKTWGSSAYVLATAFRAQSKKLGADRAIGVVPFKIAHPEQEIHLSMDHQNKTASNKMLKVTITSKDAARSKTNFTLAAVDEGVLNFTAYKIPDPVKYFLGQQKLGIEIRDVYADIIQVKGAHAKFNVGAGELMEAIKDGVVSNKRQVVALFTDTLSFDKNGVAKVELEIPDYQGALKLMALAWNKNAIGSAQSELIVKDDISIEYYMPAFISIGDSVETLLSVDFDKSLEKGEYDIKLSTQGGITLTQKHFEVEVHEDSEKFIQNINMHAESLTDGTVSIEVMRNGKTFISKRFEIAVRTAYPQTYIRKIGTLQKNETLDTSKVIDQSLWSSIHTVALKVSGKALLPVTSLKDELIDYSGRCAEQTTSRAMPWLSTTRTSSQDLIVDKAIDRLLTYQNINGGFGLWTGSRVDMWLTSYVLDFLTRAKKSGYQVPKHNIDKGLNWIENNLNRWSNDGKKQEADAYGLYVLTRLGRILMSEIKHHATVQNSKIKSAQAWAHLGASLAYVGEVKLAKQMFSTAKTSLSASYANNDFYANYGGSLRDHASLVIHMAESKVTEEWKDLFADLALNVKKRDYLSTQEMSSLLRASYIFGNTKAIDLKLTSNHKVLPLTQGEYSVKSRSLTDLPLINNHSDAASWYDLSFKATPVPSYYDTQNNNGFSITKSIYSIEGQKVDLQNIQQNDRLVVVIDGKMQHYAIENPLITDWIASGFELENPHLSGMDVSSALDWVGKQSGVVHDAYRNDRFEAALRMNEDNNTSFKIAYVLRAVSKGSFILPPAKIEDMYQPRYRAFSQFLHSNIDIKKRKMKVDQTIEDKVDHSLATDIQ